MAFRIQGLSRQSFAHLIDQPDTVLLVHHEHQRADTPFRASHAIFVRERACATWDRENEIPPALSRRLISLRAFDASHLMIDADIAPGEALPALIDRLFASSGVAYLHAHYAKWGCYAARVDRA